MTRLWQFKQSSTIWPYDQGHFKVNVILELFNMSCFVQELMKYFIPNSNYRLETNFLFLVKVALTLSLGGPKVIPNESTPYYDHAVFPLIIKHLGVLQEKNIWSNDKKGFNIQLRDMVRYHIIILVDKIDQWWRPPPPLVRRIIMFVIL